MPPEATTADLGCSTREAFCLGGLGALAPIILNLAVVDAGALLLDVTPAVVLGYTIRVVFLFGLGAFVAYLQRETDRFRAFQLGIAAPALLTGVINGHNVAAGMPNDRHAAIAIELVASAYANDPENAERDRAAMIAERDRRADEAKAEKERSTKETFGEGLVRGILGRPSDLPDAGRNVGKQ